jgi:hypothetical protein
MIRLMRMAAIALAATGIGTSSAAAASAPVLFNPSATGVNYLYGMGSTRVQFSALDAERIPTSGEVKIYVIEGKQPDRLVGTARFRGDQETEAVLHLVDNTSSPSGVWESGEFDSGNVHTPFATSRDHSGLRRWRLRFEASANIQLNTRTATIRTRELGSSGVETIVLRNKTLLVPFSIAGATVVGTFQFRQGPLVPGTPETTLYATDVRVHNPKSRLMYVSIPLSAAVAKEIANGQLLTVLFDGSRAPGHSVGLRMSYRVISK